MEKFLEPLSYHRVVPPARRPSGRQASVYVGVVSKDFSDETDLSETHMARRECDVSAREILACVRPNAPKFSDVGGKMRARAQQEQLSELHGTRKSPF